MFLFSLIGSTFLQTQALFTLIGKNEKETAIEDSKETKALPVKQSFVGDQKKKGKGKFIFHSEIFIMSVLSTWES